MTRSTHDDLLRRLEEQQDETEQLRVALESAQEENARLAADRERLMLTLTSRLDEFALLDGSQGALDPTFERIAELRQREREGEASEELRVAIQELHVLTEELEVANQQLSEQNAVLDRRVAERTAELQRANAALAVSEASFRTVTNLVPDFLWRDDADGRATWFSRRWYDLTGQLEVEARAGGWMKAIHAKDQARLRATREDALARGAAYEIEIRVEGWRGEQRWFLMRSVPFRGTDGEIVQWFGAGTDVHEQRLTYQALEASEQRFRTLLQGIPQLVWRSLAEGEWTWSSAQWIAYTGLSAEESSGLGWLEAWHPDDRAAAMAAWDRAGADEDFSAEGRIFHAGEGRYRHFRTRAKAVVAADGSTIEWLGTSTDVDDIVRLQQQQQVLVAELQHRTRNILAVVQSVVRRTVRGSDGLQDFSPRIDARLAALARVQGLLSQRADNRRIAFDQLLRAEISAHVALDGAGNGAQVSIAGPAGVPLYSATIQTMALALHELITNAIKYGALAHPDGHLDVSWQLLEGDEPRLLVEWRESGVGELPQPGDRPHGGGYGRELIERALPYQLHARTSFAFGEDGVRCTIEVPVANDSDGGAAPLP